MSKQQKRIDPRQMALDFDNRIDVYAALKEEIMGGAPVADKCVETHEEACIQVAAAIKTAIRHSGMSREQLVDAINGYFGWDQEKGKAGKRLSLHMLNHYLSKPVQYQIPAFYIFAVQAVTQSLEPVRAFAEAAGARVISGDEVRHMTMGKLDATILEMQKLKRELRCQR